MQQNGWTLEHLVDAFNMSESLRHELTEQNQLLTAENEYLRSKLADTGSARDEDLRKAVVAFVSDVDDLLTNVRQLTMDFKPV